MDKLNRWLYVLICMTAVVLILPDFLVPAAAADNKDNFRIPFDKFMEEAAGRYTVETDDGTVVLELIPAFGHLFGSVGYYMEGSLYSYYAAEFTPACWVVDGNCSDQYSSRSMEFIIRFFSNMSNAGNYWSGISQQRLTLLADDLLLSHFTGSGDALISKEMTMMQRSENAPTIFPYNAEMAESLLGKDRTDKSSDFLKIPFCAAWKEDGVEVTQQISFDENGEMTLLRQTNDLTPPLLLKGGYAFAVNDEGSLDLCFLMSSPSSGMMPYSGCAVVWYENDVLIIEEPDDDSLVSGDYLKLVPLEIPD